MGKEGRGREGGWSPQLSLSFLMTGSSAPCFHPVEG